MSKPDLETLIKNYAKQKGKITIPEIQLHFNLSYEVASLIVHSLCNGNFMFYDNGLEYRVCESSYTWQERQMRLYESFDGVNAYGNLLPPDKVAGSINDYNEKERFVLKVFAYCIIRKEAKVIDIKAALRCAYTEAYRAVEWMLYNGYVESEEIDNQNYYKPTITKQKYAKRFGVSISDALQ